MIHSRLQKLFLAAGFTVLAVLALAFHQRPVPEYEIAVLWSLSSTVLAVLVLLVVGSLWPLFFGTDRTIVRLAGCFLVLGVVFLIGMPLVRSYFYVGTGDALGHLGLARSFMRGDISMFNPGFAYPGLHAFSIVITSITGISLERATLASMVVFGVLYVCSMVVLLRLFLHSEHALAVAIVSASLLLPLNHVGVHLIPHASSAMILFSPLVIYAGFRSFRRTDGWGVVLFFCFGFFAVFLHPRQFTSVMALLVVAGGFALLRDRESRLVLISTAVLLVFQLWAFQQTAFRGRLLGIFYRLRSLLFSGNSIGAQQVSGQNRSGAHDSLADLLEFAAKLFVTDFVYVFLGGLLILVWLLVRVPQFRSHLPTVTSFEAVDEYADYFIVGFFAVAGYFVVFLAIGEAWTRFQGFVMVPTTVLGAITLDTLLNSSRRRGQLAVVAVLVALVPLAIFTFHPSPYIFSDSGHVTETSFQGYETVYSHTDDEIEITGARATIIRYEDAIFGIDRRMSNGIIRGRPSFSGVPRHFNDRNLSSYYDGPVYLTVSSGDREVFADRGEGYWLSWGDFAYLDREQTVVYSNGDVTVYRV